MGNNHLEYILVNNFEIHSVKMRMATPDDKDLPTYDHTKLSAINTCPTWGIIRYALHKRMPGSYRAMALEAGSASHEGFSAVRLFQHMHYSDMDPTLLKKNVELHGLRLFGETRLARMMDTLHEGSTSRTNAINFVVESVESCDFYDDIGDTRRTISNICESLISYVDSYNMVRYPVWIRDPGDANTDVGIEIAFDIVVEITYTSNGFSEIMEVRFTGKLDGLHYNKDELIIIEEKTGARLDDAWLSQWVLSHQITGYCLAATTFTGLKCEHALVSGMRIPIGRVPAEGIRKEYVPRGKMLFDKWAAWFVSTVEMEQQYRDNPLDAPMYTHSCNRYFSSCSFMPLCAATDVEDKLQILGEMEVEEWSPLED